MQLFDCTHACDGCEVLHAIFCCCQAWHMCAHDVLQEEADLQAAIDSHASNSQQHVLEAELLQQLQCHLACLRKQQQQLTARLDSVS